MSGRRQVYVYLSVLVIALVMTGGMAYSLWSGTLMSEKYAPLVDASMEIKLSAALAHITLEEVISKDSRKKYEHAQQQILRARWFAKAMLEGGSNMEGTFIPMDDKTLRREIEEVIVKIDEFEKISRTRYNEKQTSGFGTRIDSEYDHLFEDMLHQADDVETALQNHISEKLKTFKTTQGAIIMGTILLAIAATSMLYRFEKERTRYIDELDSARRRAEDSERWLSTTMNSMGDAVIITDDVGIVTYLNPVASTLTGWKHDEAPGHDVTEIFNIVNEETGAKVENPLTRVIRENIVVGLANHTELISKNGTRRPIADSGAPIFDSKNRLIGMVLVFHDVSDRKAYETRLKESLKEKETLLMEVHHRVKNNLSIVLSLLSLQARSMDDERHKQALTESSNRIKSMALVHEKLYQSESLSRIDVEDYLRSLIDGIMRTFGSRAAKVKSTIEAKDIIMDISTLIPVGLIVNELVTNSIKYAFREDEGGKIGVSITDAGDGSYNLTVSDDGCGLPEHLDLPSLDTSSLGLHLVNSLISQLDATAKVNRTCGTSITINFPAERI